MKKALSIISVTMLLALLVGCSNNAPAKVETVPITVATEAANSGTPGSVTITDIVVSDPEFTFPKEDPEADMELFSVENAAPFNGIPAEVINTNSLNVRSEPGTDSESIAKLKGGTVVRIFEKTMVDYTYWGKLDNGWICLDYVDLDPGDLNIIHNMGVAYEHTDDHEYEYVSLVTEATCTNRGYTTFKCKCGYSYRTEYTNRLGHDWSSWKTIYSPTVYDEGLEQRVCRYCNEIEKEAIDKLPDEHTHLYTPKSTKEATCYEYGSKIYICSCGDSYTEATSMLPHSYKSQVIEPTCDKEGYTIHICSVCGDTYTGSKRFALGHDWEHHHEDAVTHEVTYIRCNCGWSALYDNGAGQNAYADHVSSVPAEEAGNHASYTTSETVTDVPAKDWDVCRTCGTTK